MLPSSLLQTAENHPMLVELRNGDTYNGRLVKSNMYMNICLQDVICTSRVRHFKIFLLVLNWGLFEDSKLGWN